jgi:RNA polymerase sigma factor (sigma-70 family)
MQELDDLALLREYAANHSETAFQELVLRRVNFVYSAALRQVRDPHLAEEITQAVFIILAQKAGRISDKTILAGWLFKTTRYAAIAQVRDRAKRSLQRATIEKAFQMQTESQSEFQSATSDPLWERMSPLLDEALASLGETDRQVVLLRFFENKSLAEVGGHLGTDEDTARKRVSRALEKLHRFFFQAWHKFDRSCPSRGDFRQLPSGGTGGAGEICGGHGDCQRRGSQRFNLNPRERSIETYGIGKSKNNSTCWHNNSRGGSYCNRR